MATKPFIPQELKVWVEARQRHRLSHAQVQMARELGLNPKKLGKIDNHRQEKWKAPLPDFIERLYLKRYGRTRPDAVKTIEEIAAQKLARKAEQKMHKAARRAAEAEGPLDRADDVKA
jgi:hypothetical protein